MLLTKSKRKEVLRSKNKNFSTNRGESWECWRYLLVQMEWEWHQHLQIMHWSGNWTHLRRQSPFSTTLPSIALTEEFVNSSKVRGNLVSHSEIAEALGLQKGTTRVEPTKHKRRSNLNEDSDPKRRSSAEMKFELGACLPSQEILQQQQTSTPSMTTRVRIAWKSPKGIGAFWGTLFRDFELLEDVLAEGEQKQSQIGKNWGH